MKTAETKTTSASSPKAGKPFFRKGGEGIADQSTQGGENFFTRQDDSSLPVISGKAIQAKLTIGRPNDMFEKEADAMANQVVQRLSKNIPAPVEEEKTEETLQQKIQRKPIFESKAEETVQRKAINSDTVSQPVKAAPAIQAKCNDCEKEEKNGGEEENGGDGEMVQLKPIFESNGEPGDELVQRSCRECEEGNEILTKPIPGIQRSDSDKTPDSDGSRESILAAAKGELGKVEARLNDGSGSRVGADRLLEYFHIAAPGVWDDSIIETAGVEMPSWCGIFSVWAHKKAGKNIGEWQMGKGVSAFNTLSQTDSPEPGDIGYIDEPKQHHAVIKEVDGDTVHTIDGNSGTNSEVVESTKPRSKYTGFMTAFGGSGGGGNVQSKEEVDSNNDTPSTASDSVEESIDRSKGSGISLPEDTRKEMEGSFGADFSNIRVHTGSEASELSNDLHAQAFAHGSDIYFNTGKFDTGSSAGKHLLAHELTHTIQQGGAAVSPKIDRSPQDQDEEPSVANAPAFAGFSELSARRTEVETYIDAKELEWADKIVNGDPSFEEMIEHKHEIARARREELMLDKTMWRAVFKGGLDGRKAEDIIWQVYENSFDEELTVQYLVGEGLSPDEVAEEIEFLMQNWPELFPQYQVNLYKLAVEDLQEKSKGYFEEYDAAVKKLNERPTEDLIKDFIWLDENKMDLRSKAGMIHFLKWIDTEHPYFIERKDPNDTSTQLSNLKVKINDHSVEFTSQMTKDSLKFLYPLLVSWHHYQFYDGAAAKLEFFRLMVEAGYERLNIIDSYPDMVADLERTYYGSSPQVTHDTMREGFDDIYKRIEKKLDGWVQSLEWHERIKEGFGLYDVYGEMGELLRNLATPETIAMMVGFIAFLVAVQFVPYANLVVDAILLTLGGIDILKGLTIFSIYFDSASEAQSFKKLYKAAQGLKGGGEAILNLLFELIGLAMARLLKAFTRYRNAKRFQNIDELAGHEVITGGKKNVKDAFGDAKKSSKTFEQYEKTLNNDSIEVFKNQPKTRKIYSEMRDDVRRVFTHCATPCVIPGITRRQVKIVESMIDRLGGLNTANFANLKVLLHVGQNDLTWMMKMLNKVENQTQLEKVVVQEFRRRAMEPPGGSPKIDRKVAEKIPGTCTGGKNLPKITKGDEWLRATDGGVGLVPRQIADLLRDRPFKNLAEFRAEFWRAVGNDPILNTDFTPSNVARMKNGGAPRVKRSERMGGERFYELHHITPIEHGGPVYDLDNIAVTSPRYHKNIHDGGFVNGDPFLVQPKLETSQPQENGQAVNASLEDQLINHTGNGNAAPKRVYNMMLHSFAADFNQVRIHNGKTAAIINRAPSVQRHPVAPTPVARQNRLAVLGDGTPANRGLTFTAFERYTRQQGDWFAEPSLTPADRTSLWFLLNKLSEGDHILAGTGDLFLSELVTVAVADWPSLAKFGHARYANSHTLRILPTSTYTLAERIDIGTVLTSLESIIPPAVLELTVSEQQLNDIRANRVFILVNLQLYYTLFHPHLQRTYTPAAGARGLEFQKMLDIINGVGVVTFLPLMGRVRNVHRFSVPSMQRLIANYGDTTRSRPVHLVLHTGHDEESFQGAANLFEDLILNSPNLVLMIEGPETLAGVTAKIPVLASTYGQDDGTGNFVLGQVMIAGHGSARSVQLGGTGAANVVDGSITYGTPGSESLNLDSNAAATTDLLDTLIRNMNPATARIVYAGCLVGATKVPATVAPADIPAHMGANQSLAAFTTGRGTALGRPVTVEAARASVGIGSATSLRDGAGNMHITYPFDPTAFGDALTYVATGREPEGVMRAAVEVAVNNSPVVAANQLRARLAQPVQTGYYDACTRVMVTTALDGVPAGGPIDIGKINLLANIADKFFLVRWPTSFNITVNSFIRSVNPHAVAGTIYPRILATSTFTSPDDDAQLGRLVLEQSWMVFGAARANDLIAFLDATPTLNVDRIGLRLNTAAMIPFSAALFPPAAPPTNGRIRLALAWIMVDNADLAVNDFLNAQVINPTTTPEFTPAVKAQLGGIPESDVLERLGRLTATSTVSSGGSTVILPNSNAEITGDATNDVRIERQSYQATVLPFALNVRRGPSMAHPPFHWLHKGDTVQVAGFVHNWAAVDINGRLGFVFKNLITPP